MPLTRVNFAPGIDKQNTTVGAEGRWVDCNNVRFRYQLPEKVGGWSSLVTDTIVSSSPVAAEVGSVIVIPAVVVFVKS